MLVSFTVDPEVFNNSYSLSELQRHIHLIELWKNFGCLVITGKNEISSNWSQALLKAPQNIQKRWQEALKQLKYCYYDNDLSAGNIDDGATWLRNAASRIHLVSLEETKGLCWGIEEGQFSKTSKGLPEICNFGFESEAQSFKKSREMARKPIEKGTPWSQVWKERFEPFALISRTITVSDRYALKSMVSKKGNDFSGIERFLTQLSCLKSGKPRLVKLYVGVSSNFWGNPHLSSAPCNSCLDCFNECKNILTEFTKNLKGKSIAEIEINAFDDSSFASLNHYRYVRFDNDHLLHLDTGLEPLAGTTTWRTCPTFFIPWSDPAIEPYRKDEKQLLKQRRHQCRLTC